MVRWWLNEVLWISKEWIFTADERFREKVERKISIGGICFRKFKVIKGKKGMLSRTAQIRTKRQNRIW